jgi:hypothetical protein
MKPIYKNLTREEIIDALVEKDVDCITEDPTSITDALRNGIPGYENQTDQHLIEDYQIYCEENEAMYKVHYLRGDGKLVDIAEIDKKDEVAAWEIFKDLGHERDSSHYLEFHEIIEKE